MGENAEWTGATHIEQGGLQLGSEIASVVLSSKQVNIAETERYPGLAAWQVISTTLVCFRLAPLRV